MKVTAIIGTYRKGGIIDSAVDEVLSAAREEGAETEKVYLMDRNIEFCLNCRTCMQERGLKRGRCVIEDEMGGLLDTIEDSDAIVLASPMNFGTVTAVMKRFIERLACLACWPWGVPGPKMRKVKPDKVSVILVSSAAPAVLVRLLTPMVGMLKKVSRLLGARNVGVLSIGLAARKEGQKPGVPARWRARRLGRKLARSALKGKA